MVLSKWLRVRFYPEFCSTFSSSDYLLTAVIVGESPVSQFWNKFRLTSSILKSLVFLSMESMGDMWDSMYAIPVAGAFILAGAVYYLSFRIKDDDDQSLRIYLNVLSGDDERNRKAAKRLRKFGTGSPKVSGTVSLI